MKQSNMGGGEFEFNPNGLDKKVKEREEMIIDDYALIEKYLWNHAQKYVREGLGTQEGYYQSIISRLILRKKELFD